MEDTYPKLLESAIRQRGEKTVALRKKEFGIWREFSWAQCYENVRRILLGLASLGVAKGDKVSILSDNNPEWFWSELAVQGLGGVVLGLNPGSSAEEITIPLQDSQSKVVFAPDQEQVDKLIEIKGVLPSLKRVVYWNDKGMHAYDDPILMSWTELGKAGEEYEQSHPGYFDESLRLGNADDVAILFYVPGEDGSFTTLPATHGFLISSLEAACKAHPVSNRDEYVSVINPRWFFEQTLGFGMCLAVGQRLNFPESVDTAPMDSREISPHIIVYPSAAWEGIAQAIQTNVSAGTRIKRTSFRKAMSVGRERVDLSSDGRQLGALKRVGHFLADWLVFRPLRDKHGLNRARIVYASGGLMSGETVRFFKAIGIDLIRVYGSTEVGISSEEPEANLRLE